MTFVTVAASNNLIKVRQVEQRNSTDHTHCKHLQTVGISHQTHSHLGAVTKYTVTILEMGQMREAGQQVLSGVHGFALVPFWSSGKIGKSPRKTVKGSTTKQQYFVTLTAIV